MRPELQPSRRPLPDLAEAELVGWLAEVGEPGYRAAQILDWVFRRRARAADEMTDLPIALRRRLAASFSIRSGREIARSMARGGTAKLLMAWPTAAPSSRP